MESEPARPLGVAANDCAGQPVVFDSLALRVEEDEAARARSLPGKRVGVARRWDSSSPSSAQLPRTGVHGGVIEDKLPWGCVVNPPP